MPVLRTIRQRRHRARRAQVAAVATIFGLLLVVSFISAFIIQPLPNNMGQLEYQHLLQVENQLGRFQATVLAEAAHPGLGLALSSPVTLGSQALPPWATPSGGTIAPESGSISTTASYSVSQVLSNSPNWNTGSACLSGGHGTCSAASASDYWNESNSNHTSFAISISGSANSLYYNLSGNNDTLTITLSGGNPGTIYLVVNGSNDAATIDNTGTDSDTPVATILFYGQSDTFNFSPSGSHSTGGAFGVHVQFISEISQICPYGNASATDKLGSLGTGGTNVNLTAIWWNAIGYSSTAHKVTYPGGSGKNEYVTFSNLTGWVGCAGTRIASSPYQSQYSAGIVVQLQNRYIPEAAVVFDQGAVIESEVGGASAMVSPPPIVVAERPSGYFASVTLINVVGNFTESGGIATASVDSRITSDTTVTITNGASAFYLSSPLYLNITTAYPLAWYDYFASESQLFPLGASCTPGGTFLAPNTCLSPPNGQTSTISAPLYTQQLTLTSITVVVSVL